MIPPTLPGTRVLSLGARAGGQGESRREPPARPVRRGARCSTRRLGQSTRANHSARLQRAQKHAMPCLLRLSTSTLPARRPPARARECARRQGTAVRVGDCGREEEEAPRAKVRVEPPMTTRDRRHAPDNRRRRWMGDPARATGGRPQPSIHPTGARACVWRAPEVRRATMGSRACGQCDAMRCDEMRWRCAQEEEALWEEFVADRLRRGLDHAKEASNRLSPQRRSYGKARTESVPPVHRPSHPMRRH